MVATDDAGHLRLWSFATFHTVSFTVLVAVGVHLSGSLAAALRQLDTRTGFSVFLALWAITWFATRAGLSQMKPRVEEAPTATIMFSTTIAGGWNGVGIWIGIEAAGLVVTLLGRPGSVLAVILVLFLATVLGSLLAFTVGAVVGLCYGLIDAVLLRLSAWLFLTAEPVADPPRKAPKTEDSEKTT